MIAFFRNRFSLHIHASSPGTGLRERIFIIGANAFQESFRKNPTRVAHTKVTKPPQVIRILFMQIPDNWQ